MKKKNIGTFWYLIVIFVIVLVMVNYLRYFNNNNVIYYVNETFAVRDIPSRLFDEVESNMTYKDLFTKFGTTKDVGDESYKAVYRVNEQYYLYLIFDNLNDKIKYSKQDMLKNLIGKNINDYESLFLEITEYHFNDDGITVNDKNIKKKIISDKETVDKIIAIFENSKTTRNHKTPAQYAYYKVKEAFAVDGVGIVYMNVYHYWLNDKSISSLLKKEDMKFIIDEEKTQILKSILQG